jgi:predicted nucleic acid-binding Zn ribbon protein
MASYEFWCETCKIDYTVERSMEQSSDDSICVICNEKAIRKYNVTTIFKGPGFYSTDKKATGKKK